MRQFSHLKWEKIKSITKNDFSFIIDSGKTADYIDFNNLEDPGTFRQKFLEAIEKFNPFKEIEIKI